MVVVGMSQDGVCHRRAERGVRGGASQRGGARTDARQTLACPAVLRWHVEWGRDGGGGQNTVRGKSSRDAKASSMTSCPPPPPEHSPAIANYLTRSIKMLMTRS